MTINLPQNIAINWDIVPEEKSCGLTGSVISQTVSHPPISIRRLRFWANYEADHWCDKGHIIFVISGELIVEYIDGSSVSVAAGNSLLLGDHVLSHKARTEIETQVLIVD